MSDKRKNTLGMRVRQLREERGWSQSELAAHLPGVKQQSVDQLEQGRVVRPRFLPELADALGASMQWLLTGEGERRPAPQAEASVDSDLLRDVVVAVETVIAHNKTHLSTEERARLIAALYELMQREEKRDSQSMAQAAQNIIRYEQFRKSQR